MDNYIREIKVKDIDKDIKDGDTLVADIILGFKSAIYMQEIRLYGVNAYETTRRGNWDNGLSEEEVLKKIKKGKEAEAILKEAVRKSYKLFLESKINPKEIARRGKYGRWICILWIQEEKGNKPYNWNQWLIDNGYGYRYMEN